MEFRNAVSPSPSRSDLESAGYRPWQFQHPQGTSVWPKQYLVSLIERSGCTLTSLVFVGVLVYEMELRDTVRCIPTLVEVELRYGGKEDALPGDLKEVLFARRWGELR